MAIRFDLWSTEAWNIKQDSSYFIWEVGSVFILCSPTFELVLRKCITEVFAILLHSFSTINVVTLDLLGFMRSKPAERGISTLGLHTIKTSLAVGSNLRFCQFIRDYSEIYQWIVHPKMNLSWLDELTL